MEIAFIIILFNKILNKSINYWKTSKKKISPIKKSKSTSIKIINLLLNSSYKSILKVLYLLKKENLIFEFGCLLRLSVIIINVIIMFLGKNKIKK